MSPDVSVTRAATQADLGQFRRGPDPVGRVDSGGPAEFDGESAGGEGCCGAPVTHQMGASASGGC